MLIVDNNSGKYFVALQEPKGNPLLHVPGNTKHLYVVDSYIFTNNNNNTSNERMT
jgi:hypothetical protein